MGFQLLGGWRGVAGAVVLSLSVALTHAPPSLQPAPAVGTESPVVLAGAQPGTQLTALAASQGPAAPADGGAAAPAEGNRAVRPQYTYRPVLLDGDPVVEILADGDVVMRLHSAVDGMQPYARAKRVVERLEQRAQQGPPEAIRPGEADGHAVVQNSGQVLVTVHPETAEAKDLTAQALALQWANNLREALGAAPLTEEDLARAAAGGLSPWTQQGIASWYGPRFDGRPTASGEIYDRWAMTAAHRTLPFGTIVRVTLLDTGDSTVVRVNDRGPFIDGRVIDLSEQAALTLGMWERGIAPVLVEVLD